MERILDFGTYVKTLILDIAGLLKLDGTPGLVAVSLLVLLVLALFSLAYATRMRGKALDWLAAVLSVAEDEQALSRQIDSINRTVREGSRPGPRDALATAWKEYDETLIRHVQDGQIILRNAVRPSLFFNLEDLHFGPRFRRIIPGLFVTFGLFLTFLGLISALASMDLAGDSKKALSDLLTIASAKFIMSLTGLFCSIIFTIALRIGMGRIENRVHHLCRLIEQRLSFISLENLAVEQLAATTESRDQFREVGMAMVADLGARLSTELPQAISASISSAMSPLIAQVGQMSSQGVGDMVKDLSSRFTDDVGRALSQASDRLGQAGDRIATLADRMDQSSGQMGGAMEAAVARLGQAVDDLRTTMTAGAEATNGAFSQGAEALLAAMNGTLQGIRDNTGEGARAIGAAAADMRAAAEAIRSEMEVAAKQGAEAASARMQAAGDQAGDAIGKAGEGVLQAFGRTVASVAQATDEMAKKAGQQLIEPMGVIADQLDDMLNALNDSTAQMVRVSDGLRDGAKATVEASGAFRSSALSMTQAADPVRATVERLETATRNLSDSTKAVAETVGQSARSTAEHAASTLAMAREVLGGQGRAIETTLAGLITALDKMRGQGDRLDEMDAKLGRAFEEYNRQVEASVGTMFGHVKSMQDQLAPALDTLRTVVEQAEAFAPQQRRI